jgi:hypothetical protein
MAETAMANTQNSRNFRLRHTPWAPHSGVIVQPFLWRTFDNFVLVGWHVSYRECYSLFPNEVNLIRQASEQL